MAKQANSISDELLAAFMDGNTTREETQRVLDAAASDSELQELIQLSMLVDDDMEAPSLDIRSSSSRPFPMLERAACNTVDNLCAIRCEGYALRALGIDVSDEKLEAISEEKGWLKMDGTPLHYIGLLSGMYDSYINRRYDCSINDIIKTIRKEAIPIVVIDSTELIQTVQEAKSSDRKFGAVPNHAVVVKSINLTDNTIDIFDPGNPDLSKTYPLELFKEAWNDSYNYLVTISNHASYEPHPQNLAGVELEPELIELREAIAENAHEVWAQARKLEGWTYGPVRDDEKKLHPDMLPYHLLPESEKKYDRQMAISTIKLVKKLGWDFVKKDIN